MGEYQIQVVAVTLFFFFCLDLRGRCPRSPEQVALDRVLLLWNTSLTFALYL